MASERKKMVNFKSADFVISGQELDTLTPHFFDNDLAYELQRSGVNINQPAVTSWADIPIPAEKDKNRNSKQAQNKTESQAGLKNIEDKKTVSWEDGVRSYDNERGVACSDNSEGVPNSDNNRNVADNELSDYRTSVETSGHLSLNSLDDKGIRRQLDREANRNKDKEMASSLISPQAPVLSTQILDNIDIGKLRFLKLVERNKVFP